MFAFIINRILQAIPVMLTVALISFAMFAYVGDPVAIMLGQDFTEAQRDALVRDLGKTFPAVSAIRVRDAINQFNKIFDKVMTAVQVAGSVTLAAGALVLLWTGPEASGGHQPVEVTAPIGGQLDERARRASIGPVTMDLPGAPYKVAGAHSVPGILDTAFVAEATTHSRTSSQEPSWGAVVCLASVHERLTADFDLDADSVDTVRRLAEKMYGTGPTRIRHLKAFDHAVDGHGGMRVTAQIHYKIAGLPNHYDEVTAQVVRLDDGSVIAAFSSIPNDASEEIRELAAQSLASLRIN